MDKFPPRPYQAKGIAANLDYLLSDVNYNAFALYPTGAGKSVVMANTIKELPYQSVILQPSKEILVQNVAKYQSYGYEAGVYSASAGTKTIGHATFATIGSVVKKPHLFRNVRYILIDECHLVNAADGMYNYFIKSLPKAKVLGFTATPYRLSSAADGSMLSFINRTEPRIFHEMIYCVQNNTLFDAGYLSKLVYYSFNLIDASKLTLNGNGSDFTDASLRAYYRSENIPTKIANFANNLLKKRRNLLVFCSLLDEAAAVAKNVPGSVVLDGKTSDAMREKILSQFTAGIIKCVINVGVLTTGFDYPALECVLLAKSTMSLSLYYQIFGRGFRTDPLKVKKDCWLVDLGGNIERFGKFETMIVENNNDGNLAVFNNGKQLTNVVFNKLS